MVRGLQETGQSVDIELLQVLIVTYHKAFRKQFDKTPVQLVHLDQVERVELLCRARDHAEAWLHKRFGNREKKSSHGHEKTVRNAYTVQPE